MSRWAAQKSPNKGGLRKGFPSLDPEQLGACASFPSRPVPARRWGRTQEEGLETGFSFQEIPASTLLPKTF